MVLLLSGFPLGLLEFLMSNIVSSAVLLLPSKIPELGWMPLKSMGSVRNWPVSSLKINPP